MTRKTLLECVQRRATELGMGLKHKSDDGAVGAQSAEKEAQGEPSNSL